MLLNTGTARIVGLIGKDGIIPESPWRASTQKESILQNDSSPCEWDNGTIALGLFSDL